MSSLKFDIGHGGRLPWRPQDLFNSTEKMMEPKVKGKELKLSRAVKTFASF